MPQLERDGAKFDGMPPVADVIALMKDRTNSIVELADAAMLFYREPKADPALVAQHMTEAARAALRQFAEAAKTVDWTKEAIASLMKQVLADHQMKMPQLAMPLRLAVTGQLQTPSVDAVLALFGRDQVLQRVAAYL